MYIFPLFVNNTSIKINERVKEMEQLNKLLEETRVQYLMNRITVEQYQKMIKLIKQAIEETK